MSGPGREACSYLHCQPRQRSLRNAALSCTYHTQEASRKHLHPSSLLRTLVLPAALLTAAQAHAANLVLDDFATPAASQNVVSPDQQFIQSTDGVFAGVSGQRRDAYYWLYVDPLNSGATATIGAGSASVKAGEQALGELGIGYGAYGVDLANIGVQGPELGLDLSKYNGFEAVFAKSNKAVNLVVGFYTTKPLPGTGLYYWDGEVTVAHSVPGGSVTGDMLFTGNDAEHFNFSQVDGIFFVIDRAAAETGNSYDLSTLLFTQAVPEPSTYALLLAGFGVIGACAWRPRRR
jgi:hypothetical protein